MSSAGPREKADVATHPPDDAFSLDFWKTIWDKQKQVSVISRFQKLFPDRWRRFYERVGAYWSRVAGDAQGTARRVVDVLLRCGVVSPGCSVLDLGCGPGLLSVALAQAGCLVTAVDRSPSMLKALREAAGPLLSRHIKTLCVPWEELDEQKGHDVVIAAFFPDALSPHGLLRLEECAKLSCVIVASSSPFGLPYQMPLWRALMGDDSPDARHTIQCTMNTLWTMERFPFTHHLQWLYDFDEDEMIIREFYKNYFGVFGLSPQDVEKALGECLAPFSRKGRICAQGRMRLSLLWWHVFDGLP